jgi:DNA-binding CsgD family transcriptional regulator
MLLRMISTDLAMVKGPEFLTTHKKYRLGRSSECSLVVNDLSVSRFHAELDVKSESIVVKDLGSLNGTFVDGGRITKHEVCPGHAITFGVAQFRLAAHESRIPTIEEMSEVSTYAVSPKQPPELAALQTLSETQRRVLDLLLTGLAEKEVACKLDISPHTVHNHVKEIYRRMDVNSRAELLVLFVSESKLQDKPGK